MAPRDIRRDIQAEIIIRHALLKRRSGLDEATVVRWRGQSLGYGGSGNVMDSTWLTGFMRVKESSDHVFCCGNLMIKKCLA